MEGWSSWGKESKVRGGRVEGRSLWGEGRKVRGGRVDESSLLRVR